MAFPADAPPFLGTEAMKLHPQPAAAGRTPTERLVEAFAVLANPQRVALLRQLQEPQTVGEIRLPPSPTRRGGARGGAMSTQAVRKHLVQLLQHGFVQRVPAERRGVKAEAYVVDHARLYALTEELRALSSLRAMVEPVSATQQLAMRPSGPAYGKARLVVVHGLVEGHAFQLDGEPMVVGRKRSCDVRLDYDPFVSQAHARVTTAKAGWTVEDLRSRNGTHVNWVPLAKGGQAALRHGDVLGVGRSLLLLWERP